MKSLLKTSLLCVFGLEFVTSSWWPAATSPNNTVKGANQEGTRLPDGYNLFRCARVARQTTSNMLVCLNADDEPVLVTISLVANLSQFDPYVQRPPPQGKYLVSKRSGHFSSLLFPSCSPLASATTPPQPLYNAQQQEKKYGGVFECRDSSNNGNNTAPIRVALLHHVVQRKRWIEVLMEESNNGMASGQTGETTAMSGEDDSEENTDKAEDTVHHIIDPAMFVGQRRSAEDVYDEGDDARRRHPEVLGGMSEGHNGKNEHIVRFMENIRDKEDEGRLKDDLKRADLDLRGAATKERNDCADEHDPRCDLEDVRGEDN